MQPLLMLFGRRSLAEFAASYVLQLYRLTRALQTFELRPTYEDVLPVESTSVEEYLEQMHEMTTITAIQVRLTWNLCMRAHE